jgi:hypothetical protein
MALRIKELRNILENIGQFCFVVLAFLINISMPMFPCSSTNTLQGGYRQSRGVHPLTSWVLHGDQAWVWHIRCTGWGASPCGWSPHSHHLHAQQIRWVNFCQFGCKDVVCICCPQLANLFINVNIIICCPWFLSLTTKLPGYMSSCE